MNVNRILAVASIFAFGALAEADRLILLPIGKKVPFRAIKFQHLFDGADNDRSISTLGLGIGMSFEAEISYDQRFAGQNDEILDISYNMNDPVIHYAPGVSFGVRDVLDRSVEGRFGYVAMTFQEGQDGELNQDSPAEGTIGLRYGDKQFKVFAAISVPISTQLGMLAEMQTDGYFTGGLEYRPAVGAQIRWLHKSQSQYWTVGYLMRF